MNETEMPYERGDSPDDEINLARYLNVLTRWRRAILVCAILGAFAAFVASAMMSRTYTAEASLALVRSSAIVNFDSKIRTVSDADPTTINPDQASRRKSLVTLAQSAFIAQAVVNQIGAQLPESLRDPTTLAQNVKISNDGDLILVQVTMRDPALAALIANTWAQLYQARINTIYGESPLASDTVGTQAEQAKQNYETAQAALIDFLNASPLERLTREQNLLATQLDNQVAVQTKLIRLRAEAQALRQRLASDAANVSQGAELASLLLEASAFSTGAGLPVDLQIALDPTNSNVSVAEQLARLDSLIAAVDARAQELERDQPQPLVQQLNAVKAQIEAAQAKQKELEAARDLAWNTYQSLATQLKATDITAEAKNQIVRLAAPAIAPTEPSGTRRFLIVLLGGVVGLLTGVALAFALEFFASGLNNPTRVQETLHLPTLAVLPELACSTDPQRQSAISFQELRRLRYALFSHATRPSVTIASADSAADASAVAVNLAIVVAQAGKKVLLIDANLNQTLVQTAFRLEGAPGLTEALRAPQANGNLLQFAKASQIDGLSVVTAGAPVQDSAGMLDTPAFRALVAKAQANFDHVILNAPPILERVDPIIVAQATHGIVLVLDRVDTLPKVASQAKQRLDDAQVQTLGVVLSHTSANPDQDANVAPSRRFWLGMRSRVLQLLGPFPS